MATCHCDGDYNWDGTAMKRHPNFTCPTHGEEDKDHEVYRLAQVLATERYSGARLIDLDEYDRADLIRQAEYDFAAGKRY